MDTSFFYLSKILWALLAPDMLFAYLLMAGVLCLYMQRLKAAKRLLLSCLSLVLIVAFLPVGQWLLYPLEARFPANPELPAKVDGIILLGGTVRPLLSATWGQAELGNSAEREIAFMQLAREYPAAKLLMTGGNGALLDQQFREADVSQALFKTLGMSSNRIVFERDARNTYENAINSKSLMQPRPGETWVLVTSAYHMPRSVGIFCEQDWPVVAWPVDHQTTPEDRARIALAFAANLNSLTNSLREWAGLIVYYITGKTSGLLPAACATED